ncbi:hypothetical protein Tco_0034892, partial [Tanacetum coccineum]
KSMKMETISRLWIADMTSCIKQWLTQKNLCPIFKDFVAYMNGGEKFQSEIVKIRDEVEEYAK